jgi:hypothetical protein
MPVTKYQPFCLHIHGRALTSPRTSPNSRLLLHFQSKRKEELPEKRGEVVCRNKKELCLLVVVNKEEIEWWTPF